jgi:hypothetical protein
LPALPSSSSSWSSLSPSPRSSPPPPPHSLAAVGGGSYKAHRYKSVRVCVSVCICLYVCVYLSMGVQVCGHLCINACLRLHCTSSTHVQVFVRVAAPFVGLCFCLHRCTIATCILQAFHPS